MSIPIYETVSGANYRLLAPTTAINNKYIISPFDLNGNLIPEILLDVDTTLAEVFIYVPSLTEVDDVPFNISTNGQTNFIIKILKVSDDATLINIVCAPFTKFSGIVPIEGISTIQLQTLKDSLEITPIGLATANTYQVILNYSQLVPN